MRPAIIFVVDYEPVITETLVLILNNLENEFLAMGFTDASEAVAAVRGIHPDLVLLAAIMPGTERLEHALEMRDKCGCTVLLMSGQAATGERLEQLERAGHVPFEIVAKPIYPTELIAKIREALDRPGARTSRQKTLDSVFNNRVQGEPSTLPNTDRRFRKHG